MRYHTMTRLLVVFVSFLVAALPTYAITPVNDDVVGPQNLPSAVSLEDWKQIRAEYESHRHAVVADGDGYRARNPRQQWESRWDGTGLVVAPDHGEWSWGLALTSFGFDGTERMAPPAATARVERNKVSYRWDAQLTEWYLNDTTGIEHGFTVYSRPGIGSGPLRFHLRANGGLVGRNLDNGAIHFYAPGAEQSALKYENLRAWDANGKALPATMSVVGDALTISVDEAGAQYPITVDPDVQQAYLKAANSGADDEFGYSMAADGETLVVGAPGEASSATGVNGNAADDSAADAGAVYVFVRTDGVWTQQAYLKASNTGAGDRFGASVQIQKHSIIVGATMEDSGADGVNGDQTSNTAANSGAAYIFVRSGTTWTQQAYLKAIDSEPGDLYGASVAIFGDTALVGAPEDDSASTGINGVNTDNSADRAGAAFVYVRTGTVWTLQAYLKASNTDPIDFFGTAVALTADVAAVTAPGEDSDALTIDGDQGNNSRLNSGATYVFERVGTTWTQTAYVKASNSVAETQFGRAAAASGRTIVIGAADARSLAPGGSTDTSISVDGVAYVFVRKDGGWVEEARLSASNAGGRDTFGRSVALYRDVLVVGAPGESSSETGVHADQFDPATSNAAEKAGAAYVFVRRAGAWTQHAYLKASNTEAFDNFGTGVAVMHFDAIVGAALEDSDADGIDGAEGDNSAMDAGAGYAYRLVQLFDGIVYEITSVRTGEPISVDGDGALIGSASPSSPDAGRFTLEAQSDGTFVIRNRETGLLIRENGPTGRDFGTTMVPIDDFAKYTIEPQPDGSHQVRVKANTRRWHYRGTPTNFVTSHSQQPEDDAFNFRFERLEFSDVDAFFQHRDAIQRMFGKAITDGCGEDPLRFCPDGLTTRGQMAVFIIRALFGNDDFDFPATPIFTDVPLTNPFFKWIQKLAELGITDGCADAPLRYCPDAPIKRSQMAVFIIRARYGPGVVFPFSGTPVFGDVPSGNPFFSFIQRLFQDRITSGCGGTPLNFCNGDFIPRWQMAVFVIRGLCNDLLPLDQPRILSATGNEIAAGSSGMITLEIENMDLTSGSPTVILGPDLTLDGMTVVDADTLMISVTVAAGAPTGPRAVTVILGDPATSDPRGVIVTAVP